MTNVQLHKCKLVDNDLCCYCKEEKKTVFHLSFYCAEVKQLSGKIFLIYIIYIIYIYRAYKTKQFVIQ